MTQGAPCRRQRRLAGNPLEHSSDADLLGTLGGGVWTRELVEHLVSACGGAAGLLRRTREELRALGIPAPLIGKLLVVAELARRFAAVPLRRGQVLRSSADLYGHFSAAFRELKKEQFWSLLLDGKNRLMEKALVSEGSLTSSLVHPREVFVPAIRHSAAAVLFVHNHPSGDPAPSREDLEITQRLVQTGKIIGIRVLDHVIIGADSYVSFADRGMI